VPLDWDRPNGPTISLALIRHFASKPEQRIGTLFINPGGPGSSGVDLLQSADPAAWAAGRAAWERFVAENRRLWEAGVRAYGFEAPSGRGSPGGSTGWSLRP
jgi:hypothetical protein